MTTIARRHALRMASAAAVGGAATASLAAPAHASTRAQELTLYGRRTAANIPGVLTAGVPYFVHFELRDQDGEVVGTESAHSTPITVGTDGALILSTIVLRLTDGTITGTSAFERPLPAVTEGVTTGFAHWSHTFAVTGGTGAHRGASGELTIEHTSTQDSVLTVALD
ncbi:hypothetical protein ACWGB8_30215 [Kitasatospora sp. NPDC054939]